ncbi:MAG: cyclic nucleotide-binding domain-containing protein [Pseudomonadota bacterium]
MRQEDRPLVRRLKLFAAMTQARFDALMQAAYLQNFPPQVDLIHEGDRADFLHVVTDGGVELYARANGREATMGIAWPVSAFILAAVFTDAVYLMSARTLMKSRILMIPAEAVREAFAEDPAFAKAAVCELARSFRAVVKAHKNLKLRSSVERLANYLLRELRRQGEGDKLTLATDKRTLAGLLGMTPENLSRAFNTLGPYGVAVEGSVIRLDKIEDLTRLAKPTPLIDDLEP